MVYHMYIMVYYGICHIFVIMVYVYYYIFVYTVGGTGLGWYHLLWISPYGEYSPSL